jgi:hypothetical protein
MGISHIVFLRSYLFYDIEYGVHKFTVPPHAHPALPMTNKP